MVIKHVKKDVCSLSRRIIGSSFQQVEFIMQTHCISNKISFSNHNLTEASNNPMFLVISRQTEIYLYVGKVNTDYFI